MRKEAYYFSHDSNSDIDPKMTTMMLNYKATGYGWYFIILSAMREQKNYKLELDKNIFKYLSRRCYTTPKKIEKFIQDCVEVFELFKKDENFLFSLSFLERMGLKEKKSKTHSEGGLKGMAKRWGNDNLVITTDNKERKVKEIKENKNKEEAKKRDPFCGDYFEKIFSIYSETCTNLAELQIFEKRNGEVRKKITLFCEETEDNFEYFREVCKKANTLLKIANNEIDLKSILNNHIGIMNGKYGGGSGIDFTKYDLK